MTGRERLIKRERLADSRELVAMQDKLYNLASGLGGRKDKTSGTLWLPNQQTKQQLETAYRSDWIARKLVDIPAYDATREWRTWQADENDITAIEDVEKKFNMRKKLMMALTRGRLYGGGALIIGVDQGKSDEPLEVESLKKDCLKWVHPVSRYEIGAGEIDWNLESPYFGTPAYYTRTFNMVTATAGDPDAIKKQAAMNATVMSGGQLKIHASRVVRFVGMETPEWNQTDGGWGDSVLSLCADAILALGTVTQALASLVQDAKIDIVRIPELSERITNKGYEQRLQNRFGTANLMKSMFSILMLDKEEEWQQVTRTFTGIPEIIQQFMMMVCGAGDIPATRFMGQSPQGMNATGDSDQENYYDKVSTTQEVEIQPNITTLDDVICISALGEKPDGIHYNWNPLWQMSDAQMADIEVKRSVVMTADVNAGLIDPQVLQKARENQLIESGFYPGLEQIIEEFGTDINERAPDPTAVPTHIDPATGLPADPAANPNAIPNPDHPNPFSGRSPPVPANGNEEGSGSGNDKVPPGKKKAAAADAIADRVRAFNADATTPRTLYIRRDVLNYKEIASFYKKVGVQNVYGEEMHVTICYSKTPVDWLKVGSDSWGNTNDDGSMNVKPGGPRVNEKFGKYLVLAFANSDLAYRHCSILERTDGSWDYDDYTPHVSISTDPGAVDPMQLPAYTGTIELGPEIFEEIKVEAPTPEGEYDNG